MNLWFKEHCFLYLKLVFKKSKNLSDGYFLLKFQVAKGKQMKHRKIKSSYCLQLKNLVRGIFHDLQIL